MSIRTGIYDFFAYTIPGIFYLFIVGFGLFLFNINLMDLFSINTMSYYNVLILIFWGFIVGIIMDTFADKFVLIFIKSHHEARDSAFNEFSNKHPWVKYKIKPVDWAIMMMAIKKTSREMAADIEQHNVAHIMLRNLCFGFALVSLLILIYFILSNKEVIFLLYLFISLCFFLGSMRQCVLRRYWFYMNIFEAFAAIYCLERKTLKEIWELGSIQKNRQKSLV